VSPPPGAKIVVCLTTFISGSRGSSTAGGNGACGTVLLDADAGVATTCGMPLMPEADPPPALGWWTPSPAALMLDDAIEATMLRATALSLALFVAEGMAALSVLLFLC
jgi:hypothetical protein